MRLRRIAIAYDHAIATDPLTNSASATTIKGTATAVPGLITAPIAATMSAKVPTHEARMSPDPGDGTPPIIPTG